MAASLRKLLREHTQLGYTVDCNSNLVEQQQLLQLPALRQNSRLDTTAQLPVRQSSEARRRYSGRKWIVRCLNEVRVVKTVSFKTVEVGPDRKCWPTRCDLVTTEIDLCAQFAWDHVAVSSVTERRASRFTLPELQRVLER